MDQAYAPPGPPAICVMCEQEEGVVYLCGEGMACASCASRSNKPTDRATMPMNKE